MHNHHCRRRRADAVFDGWPLLSSLHTFRSPSHLNVHVMPFYYCIDNDVECLLIRGTGRVANEDLEAILEGTLSKPRISRHVLRVWDTRAINELVFTPDVIRTYRSIAREYRHVMGDQGVVIVSRELVSTVAKLFTTISKQEYKFVESPEEAEDWLGLDRNTLEFIADRHEWTEA